MTCIRTVSQAFLTLLFAVLLWSGAVLAQVSTDDYSRWETIATRAEAMADAGRADDERLEAIRQQVADWREQFLEAQRANASRIQTLQAQLEALGAAPENGAETPEIAEQRELLSQQLAQQRAPVVRAEAAYSRANAIVGEIDSIIRERQADALLELGTSPLNPSHWPVAVTEVTDTLSGLWQELVENVADDRKRAAARQNLPLILLFMLLGVMLVARGPRWARAGVEKLSSGTRRGSGVFRFLVSLGKVVLPFFGVVALLLSINATSFAGSDWAVLLNNLGSWVAMLFGIRWLAEEAFNDDDNIAVLLIPHEERSVARQLSNALAFLYVLKLAVDTLVEIGDWSAATATVAQFPILVLSGLMLVRLGRVRNDAAMVGTREAREKGPGDFRLRFARLLGRACQIVGVAGPVMAAIGYSKVAETLVYPTIATLALVGLIMVVQRFINSLYELFSRRDGLGGDSLWPVLGGFALAMLALPALALIWGARVADLTEIWTRAQEGISIGETQITPMSFIVVILVFATGYMLTRLLQGALRTSVLPKTQIDQGGQNAIVSGVGYVGIFIAVIIAITSGGLDLSAFAYVAGALSLGIGFGLQNIVSNFVSGIILLVERPIGEGDWIEVNGTHGIVKDISVRSTRIETFDRFDMIIPNADFVSGTVSNYTRGNSLGRIIVEVGVAYGTDTRKVEGILLEIARRHEAVLINPPPAVDFMGFGADSLDFRIRAILHDVGLGLIVKTEMRHQIVERFTQEGIEIPFAQRDLWLRNPEVLAEARRQAALEEDEDQTGQSVNASRKPKPQMGDDRVADEGDEA